MPVTLWVFRTCLTRFKLYSKYTCITQGSLGLVLPIRPPYTRNSNIGTHRDMSTTPTMGKVARVVWAGTYNEELYQLITIFASVDLEERTQLVSLDRHRCLLTVCILKFFPQARTLCKVTFFWGEYSRNPLRCYCQGRGRRDANRCSWKWNLSGRFCLEQGWKKAYFQQGTPIRCTHNIPFI